MSVTLKPSATTLRPKGTVRGTYFVQTWGCQMNEEDSEQLALYLKEIGFEPSATPWDAHVVLLNTCSVRKKPEDKAFSMLGALAEAKQKRPEMIIGVCGCMAQLRADEIRTRAPFVDFVIGTANLGQIPGLVEEAVRTRRFQKAIAMPERKGAVVTDIPQRQLNRNASLKAFVPIQYGCDKFCAFCIVPTTRGRERSRPTEHILEEVQRLAKYGTKEVTLLGQTVNSYGKNLAEGRVPFAKLLEQVAAIDGVRRIRYISPYPRDFTADLIETIRECEKVMEHVHLPLQSGDADVLKAMRRLYTPDSFQKIVEDLRAAVPWMGITTDIIVGFPGETEEQFESTLELLRKVRFDGAYMFIYSPRPGTPASTEVQVGNDVKKARLNRLIELQNRITCEINASLVGAEFEVMVEGPSPKAPTLLQGYSRQFKMLHFAGDGLQKGDIVAVKATEPHLWGLSGNLV